MQVLIVESYGGRDEPVDTLTNNFVGVGVEPALDPVRVREEPNEATYQVSSRSVDDSEISALHAHGFVSLVIVRSSATHQESALRACVQC